MLHSNSSRIIGSCVLHAFRDLGGAFILLKPDCTAKIRLDPGLAIQGAHDVAGVHILVHYPFAVDVCQTSSHSLEANHQLPYVHPMPHSATVVAHNTRAYDCKALGGNHVQFAVSVKLCEQYGMLAATYTSFQQPLASFATKVGTHGRD